MLQCMREVMEIDGIEFTLLVEYQPNGQVYAFTVIEATPLESGPSDVYTELLGESQGDNKWLYDAIGEHYKEKISQLLGY